MEGGMDVLGAGAMTQPELSFDGPDLNKNDKPRLTRLHDSVLSLMLLGGYRTYAEIRAAVGRGSEGGIAARLRDFRKPKFGGYVPGQGGYVVDKRRCGDGLWEFRLRKLRPEESPES